VKTEKMQQNPVKHFLHAYELNSYRYLLLYQGVARRQRPKPVAS